MVIVISLGGSIIVPNNVDYGFLSNFEKVIKKIAKKNKVVIVTGGGSTARKYIEPLVRDKADDKVYSLIGIATTKLNARLVNGLFGFGERKIPDSLVDVKNALRKHDIVVCGALGFKPDMTSDGDAAEIAEYLKADVFLNLTNVDGLFDKDPKYKDAKLISMISFDDFYNIAKKIKFKAGQHFVLDFVAAEIIRKAKIKTIILNGRKLKNLENCLKEKKFVGTIVS